MRIAVNAMRPECARLDGELSEDGPQASGTLLASPSSLTSWLIDRRRGGTGCDGSDDPIAPGQMLPRRRQAASENCNDVWSSSRGGGIV